MKRKWLLVLLCALATVLMCTSMMLTIYAQETDTDGIETFEVHTSLEVNENDGIPEEPMTEHTLFTRVWEYCVENKTEMLGLAGDAVIFLLAVFVKIRNDKKTKLIASDLKVVKDDAAGTALNQKSVVGSVNSMIDGYNEMKRTYERYESVEDDRNKLVGAVMVQNTALLEILTTVYANSKNLPQGVKDIITLKYANCQKALGDDQMLCAIVESVREKIGTSQSEPPASLEGDSV